MPVTSVPRLTETQIARWDADPDLSDEARVRLHEPDDDVVHLLADDGYAQLDRADGGVELLAGSSATVGELLHAATTSYDGDVLVWSRHDDDPASPVAAGVRAAHGTIARQLLRMRRPASALPEPRSVPGDVVIRAFRPGRDDAAWLAVNATAFAHHPEQGRLTAADLAAREAEDWFDPAGFLLAWRGDDVVGFHWTKRHPGGEGEVYALGVAPTAQGTGLGGALLDAGLAHLGADARPTLLYVEADNPGAVRLYERSGFAVEHRDVRYRIPHTGGR